MSRCKLYIGPLLLILWGVAAEFVPNSDGVVVSRLVSCGLALAISFHESVVANRHRKRRRRAGNGRAGS